MTMKTSAANRGARKREPILLQTLVPVDAAKWVRSSAKREGLSVAAWLRRMLLLSMAKESSGRQAS
jgi:hypothetical protein